MGIKTRMVVFTAPMKCEMREGALPRMGPDDVVYKTVLSACSSGTERWAITGQRPDIAFPAVVGYLNCGNIVAAGKNVKHLKAGDRATCGVSRTPRGVNQGWGAHVEYGVIDATECFKIPRGLEWEDVIFDHVGAVGLHGNRLGGVKKGDTVVVIGQGMIGNAFAQVARSRGAFVITSDLKLERVKLSRKIAADVGVDASKKDLRKVVKRHCPKGADVVVEAIGFKELIPYALEMVRDRGKIILQGWYPGEVSINFHNAHAKHVCVYFPSHLEGRDKVLRMTKSGRMQTRPFITHVFDVQEAAKAFKLVAKPSKDFIGAVIDWRSLS